MERFNIRVYGIWIEKNTVLLSKEIIRGVEIIKFPGGGLQFGEGTIDCLKREWLEELDTEIEILSHLYTTDFFQASAYDNSQVMSIYYLVRPTTTVEIPVFNGQEHFFFYEINNELSYHVSLPIDKVVANKIAALG